VACLYRICVLLHAQHATADATLALIAQLVHNSQDELACTSRRALNFPYGIAYAHCVAAEGGRVNVSLWSMSSIASTKHQILEDCKKISRQKAGGYRVPTITCRCHAGTALQANSSTAKQTSLGKKSACVEQALTSLSSWRRLQPRRNSRIGRAVPWLLCYVARDGTVDAVKD